MIDEPIIVSGGSVEITISDKFKENGKDKNKKKYKLDTATLLTLKVNGETVRELQPNDVITVHYDDGE